MINPPADLSIREYVYCHIDWANAKSLLDLGCGDGYDLRRIAERASPDALLVGLDNSAVSIDEGRNAGSGYEQLIFQVADIEKGIPFDEGSFDIILSKNLLECIIDKEAHLHEIRRVLRSGGQIVCAHYDWDSQIIDGDDKDLVRRIIHVFGDWKQAWMADCDAWMGRRLWRTFQASGLFEGSVHATTLAETRFEPGTYGHGMINDFRALERRGMISGEQFEQFADCVEQLAKRGEYLYCLTMFVYVGRAK